MVWAFLSSGRSSSRGEPATPPPNSAAHQRLGASGYSPTGAAFAQAATASQQHNTPAANLGAVKQHTAASRKAAEARAPNRAREQSTRVQGVMQRSDIRRRDEAGTSQPSRIAAPNVLDLSLIHI